MPRRISIPPPLGRFLGAYFNQDWILDHATWKDVVESYVSSEPAELVAAASTELKTLLATERDDAVLERRLFREYGCHFDPSSVGLSARAWLEDVLRELERRANEGAA
jgi:regulator of sirC expression with transglutaminase-like and TPR domain